MQSYHSTTHHVYTPEREIVLDHHGAIMIHGTPRYDTLNEYVEQFAAPISQHRGLYTFRDVCRPEHVVLVECVKEPTCQQCDKILDQCECPF